MPLRVNTNVPSINVQRIGKINNKNLAMRLERLSSGLKINRAADDASGLSVSEGMRAEIGGMMQANRNTEQAINLIQTAEGALNEVSAMLIRMRELAVASASSTINNTNRESLNAEVVQLANEIDRIANVTSYNNQVILTGFGNTVDKDPTVSTSLASPTTGLLTASISSAQAGTYTFIDSVATDNQITLGQRYRHPNHRHRFGPRCRRRHRWRGGDGIVDHREFRPYRRVADAERCEGG